MKILRFEEIKAWQEARKLVNLVYDAINSNTSFKKDFRLANQIQGAAVSSMANIAEGFARRSKKDFIQVYLQLLRHQHLSHVITSSHFCMVSEFGAY